jgi:broad specificity phosphatase PhoE
MKVYLCRHGETTTDIEDRYGGDYEDHLTEKGKSQAEELAEKLIGKNIEMIWSSPKIRAQETAEIINRKLKVSIKMIDEFRERNHYGILTGMTKSEAKEKFPKEVEAVKSYLTAATNGEGYEQFGERVMSGLRKINSSGLNTVCLLTHGGPIRYIFRELIKIGEVNVSDCAYAELELLGKDVKVLNLDGISKKEE